MLIVGENLKALVDQRNIISDKRCFDETSLSLSLDRDVLFYEPEPGAEVVYGSYIPENWIRKFHIPDEGIVLAPHTCILGCSRETVTMPAGYFGLIQTKGTLARLFVQVTCNDGQVDPGYRGRVTFEIVNLSPSGIRLMPNPKVAQLFIFKTSTRAVKLYNGRYQGAQGPTVARPED